MTGCWVTNLWSNRGMLSVTFLALLRCQSSCTWTASLSPHRYVHLQLWWNWTIKGWKTVCCERNKLMILAVRNVSLRKRQCWTIKLQTYYLKYDDFKPNTFYIWVLVIYFIHSHKIGCMNYCRRVMRRPLSRPPSVLAVSCLLKAVILILFVYSRNRNRLFIY